MTLLTFLLIGILGGTTGSLVKFAALEIPPILLATIRLGLSVLILTPFILKFGLTFPKGKSKLILLSSVFLAANIILFSIGVRHTSAIMSQLIYVPTGMIVAFLGYFVLNEKLKKNHVIGLVITIIGVLVLANGSIKTSDLRSFGEPFGNLLIVIALFSWASYIVVSRKLVKNYSPLSLTFINFSIAGLIAIALLPFEEATRTFDYSQLNPQTYLAMVSVAITATGLIFLLQNFIKRTTAFIASLFTYINPIAAAIWGIFLFKESPTVSLIGGSLIIFTGVFIATSYNYIKNRNK